MSETDGVHHKDGPIAQIRQMADWVDAERQKLHPSLATMRKIRDNLRSAATAVEQEIERLRKPPASDDDRAQVEVALEILRSDSEFSERVKARAMIYDLIGRLRTEIEQLRRAHDDAYNAGARSELASIEAYANEHLGLLAGSSYTDMGEEILRLRNAAARALELCGPASSSLADILSDVADLDGSPAQRKPIGDYDAENKRLTLSERINVQVVVVSSSGDPLVCVGSAELNPGDCIEWRYPPGITFRAED